MTVHPAERTAWARPWDCSAQPGSAWGRRPGGLAALPPCPKACHPLPSAAQRHPSNLPSKLSSRSACTPARFLNLRSSSLAGHCQPRQPPKTTSSPSFLPKCLHSIIHLPVNFHPRLSTETQSGQCASSQKKKKSPKTLSWGWRGAALFFVGAYPGNPNEDPERPAASPLPPGGHGVGGRVPRAPWGSKDAGLLWE
ncbi:hypothetical protein HJG60_008169 [Phyllostomus discolor]|uniref:Uncharacterized protein n=1 Tax=Phyllostomus discolor TaxID=89673 RepID=A0A833Z8N3_9CHIR|nr:hypothetical protein HJG60_008169 [Phyllostomus discolor]